VFINSITNLRTISYEFRGYTRKSRSDTTGRLFHFTCDWVQV